jgi:hypothetical protein
MNEKLKIAEIRKKERIQKLKSQTETTETLKVAIDPIYK